LDPRLEFRKLMRFRLSLLQVAPNSKMNCQADSDKSCGAQCQDNEQNLDHHKESE